MMITKHYASLIEGINFSVEFEDFTYMYPIVFLSYLLITDNPQRGMFSLNILFSLQYESITVSILLINLGNYRFKQDLKHYPDFGI